MIRYLSLAELAERIGINPRSASTYSRDYLPPADAMVGNIRGWLPETVDAWHAARPGRGNRSLG